MSDQMSEEEISQLVATFQQLKVKPKADSPEILLKWMSEFSTGSVKTEDVSHAFGTQHPSHPSAAQVFTVSHPPSLPCFSGDEGKSNVSYDLWRYEVDCILKDKAHSGATIEHSIRKSLRGEAARVAMRLGSTASLSSLLDKLRCVYDTSDSPVNLLAAFYTARQRDDEDVNTWCCRLEDLLSKAVDAGEVIHQDTNKLLHSMLWTGLKPSIKDVSGHKFDLFSDFDVLRRELRQIEREHNQRRGDGKVKGKQSATSMAAVTETTTQTELKELRGMIKSLTSEVASLKKQQQQPPQDHYQHPTGEQARFQSKSYDQTDRSNTGWYPQSSFQTQRYDQSQYRGRSRGRPFERDVQCFRCGQFGHIASGCRVRMDHSRQHLNGRWPMRRGGP
ncbi:uncharacterized protein LOC125378638 [Haliotis rufescens]|uniref:uncharacterized protein LOC125378638 n=1 Tax=Haliotis rufescens TaxID=6454 RepID=UPI00201F5430|nr:uncharacterized protein LOC125378638 [Haliotis rufescens]